MISVLGSINLDLVAAAQALPAPGETVTGATFARHPGGKGANQALAARRLGAEVALVGRVGRDANADAALALLRAGGVDLSGCTAADAPTGVALIAVDARGENQIVVAPGANATLTPGALPALGGDALTCQLELPVETVAAACAAFAGLVCVNLAPAAPVPDALLARADLIVVNDGEASVYGARLDSAGGLVAVTHGARGATLRRGGTVVAKAKAPAVEAIDTTGAGDTFVAALVVRLLELAPSSRHPGESRDPGRRPDWVPAFAGMTDGELGDALHFACAAGAAAVRRAGAQPALPSRAEVEALLR